MATHSTKDDDHVTPSPQIVSPSFSYSENYSRSSLLLSPSFNPLSSPDSRSPSILDDDESHHSQSHLQPQSHTQGDEYSDHSDFLRQRQQRRTYSNYSSRPDSPLNLGAESPGSILKPAITPVRSLTPATKEWQDSGIAVVHTDVAPRSRLWRSASFQRRKDGARMLKKDEGMDCGICFEPPTQPRKMKCCGSVFCLEHITNWLYGVSSDGRCPACKKYFFAPSRPSSPQLRTPETHPPPYELTIFSASDGDSESEGDTADSVISPISAHASDTSASSANALDMKEGKKGEKGHGHGEKKTLSMTLEDHHVYERIISLVGLTLFLCVVFGWV